MCVVWPENAPFFYFQESVLSGVLRESVAEGSGVATCMFGLERFCSKGHIMRASGATALDNDGPRLGTVGSWFGTVVSVVADYVGLKYFVFGT